MENESELRTLVYKLTRSSNFRVVICELGQFLSMTFWSLAPGCMGIILEPHMRRCKHCFQHWLGLSRCGYWPLWIFWSNEIFRGLEVCCLVVGCSHQNFDFPKKSAFIAHLKALNKSFLEWACFLNLDKRFMRYSNFCTCKTGVF